MNIIEEVRNSWGWTGIVPIDVIDENSFGNIILRDIEGKIWRLSPEDVYCKVISESTEDFRVLVKQPDFIEDWYMEEIASDAISRLGVLPEGRKYYLVIPGVLGGEYYGDNVQSISFVELIRVSGSYGYQLKDLKAGDKVDLKVINAPS
ncbi:T6SS immunity protein Tdi1 domain-containing protein [Microbulbifer sp. EKSA008]|uniref:T6SS immunity protein Tdi1 domain-containing protein n=1 Tax=unclassified Microbulbifer TaxID=2619833 RepID=UPI0040420888